MCILYTFLYQLFKKLLINNFFSQLYAGEVWNLKFLYHVKKIYQLDQLNYTVDN